MSRALSTILFLYTHCSLAAGATVCKPYVTLVQCHCEHQWKPRGVVRTVATLGPQKSWQRAFLPLPYESCKWEWFGVE